MTFPCVRIPRLLLVGAMLPCMLRADVVLAPLFQDHAVLQRDKPLPIWGRADPGEAVEVRFAGQAKRTTTNATGRWSVVLAPVGVATHAAEMEVVGRNRVVIRDLLVGEVWLCSGQSNMAWSVGASANPDFEIAAANWPLIRQIKIPLQVADSPQDTVGGRWEVCSPCTVGTFTAVGYYFARAIHRKLGVPVGIVNPAVGGSIIEAWLSEEALAQDPKFAVVGERWKRVLAAADPVKVRAHQEELAAWHEAVARAARANDGSVPPVRPLAPPGPGHFGTPSGLYNGKIAPLVPYALRGFLWYQGEGNAGRAGEYRTLFPALIRDWRTAFRQGELPFYWVQLPNFLPKDSTGMTWALLRAAQAEALALNATGQAITIDVGSPDNGHPYNKQDVGHRLALIALAKTYGQSVEHSGPGVRSVEPVAGGLRVEFSDAERGLRVRGALVGFELAGADEHFAPAEARIEGDAVVVWSSAVKDPVFVRYAWTNNPTASLFNEGGLPAGPFRARVGQRFP